MKRLAFAVLATAATFYGLHRVARRTGARYEAIDRTLVDMLPAPRRVTLAEEYAWAMEAEATGRAA